MHGYAGNPLNYPAAVTLLDDPDLNPATAAALDTPLQNLADRTAYLNGIRAGVVAEFWQTPFQLGSGHISECKPAWDSIHGRWLFGSNDGANIGIGAQAGTGVGYALNTRHLPGSSPVALASRITCVIKDPDDVDTYYMAAIATSGNVGHIYRYKLSTQVYTSILTSSTSCSDAQIACFNGRVIVAFAEGASGAELKVSTNGGTTFSNALGSTPIDNDATWTFVHNATQLLLVGNRLFSTDEPGYMLSTDGTTFTTENFGAFFAVGDLGIGTAWGLDLAGRCFIFCFKPAASSGTTRRFLRSSDGITWTDVGIPLTSTPIQDFAAVDACFMGFMVDAAGVDGSRIVYSLDGAQSWQMSQLNILSFFPASLRLGAGPAQFCATCLDNPGLESVISFSAISGPMGAITT